MQHCGKYALFRELVEDFRRPRLHPEPVNIKGGGVKVVHTTGLDCRHRCSVQEKTEPSLRTGILQHLQGAATDLSTGHGTVVASALMYAAVCWKGCSLRKRDAAHLDRLLRKAGSFAGAELDSLTPVAE